MSRAAGYCWLIPEARRAGRNPWLWVIATLFHGSIGPLLYLAFTRSQQSAAALGDAERAAVSSP